MNSSDLEHLTLASTDNEAIARFPLARLPTPLHDASHLRAALGGEAACPRILLKRDDLTDLFLGGNKARKLEYLVGAALSEGATVLITSGGLQSNHARMTAAAACRAGMKCVLVLSGHEASPAVQGNLLLDRIVGAEVHVIEGGNDEAAAARERETIEGHVARLRERGEKPCVIPLGGSNAIGALGYVEATFELTTQLSATGEKPDRLYYASGSRGTQAGLELGVRLHGAPWRCIGVAVSGGEAVKRELAVTIANGAATLLGADVKLRAEELETIQDQIGPGYAIPTPACIEAIELVARTEGVALDPVYTAKGMAGLIDHIRKGEIAPSETVIFLHTGGSPGLFGLADVVAPMLSS
jgi:D-cysteine desulfhydrase family pyridoxal phosphate-dependent enzyme